MTRCYATPAASPRARRDDGTPMLEFRLREQSAQALVSSPGTGLPGNYEA